jgi:NADH-quinone oxidoreductase subunit N
MSVLMFSMAGFPPFAGFIGKYLVFLSAVKAKLTWYAALGILSSVVGAWYYLRVIVVMYFMKPEGNEEPLVFPAGLNPTILSAIAIVVLLFILGVYPSPIASYLDVLAGAARSATASL